MRVMLYNGTIKIIDREEDLRFWRNSFGLLGIILGVELPLIKREAFQIYTSDKRAFDWSADEFWRYIKHDGEADIPEGVPEGGLGGLGSREALSGEFFLNWESLNKDGDHYPNKAQMIGVVQKWGTNATNEGIPKEAPSDVEEQYNGLSATLSLFFYCFQKK